MNPFTLLRNGLNRLLPFATPGTPILQDLLHLAALCTVLYYAPQIQTYVQGRLNLETESQAEDQAADPQQTVENDQTRDINADEQPTAGNWAQPHASDEDEEDDENENETENDDFNPIPNAEDIAEGQPGPANPRPINPRTVGAKKAKSLARRDQRRAYHEFMRSQGEAQRARDAEEAKEREEFAAEERARRVAAEAELEVRRAKEREERRVRENRVRELEMGRRERAVGAVREEVRRTGMCDLEGVARGVGGVDREWVEGLVRASGMLNEGAGDARVVITEAGWVVKVTREDLDEVYRIALESAQAGDEQGRVSTGQLGGLLEGVLNRRAQQVV